MDPAEIGSISDSLRSIAASAQESSDPYERNRADQLTQAALRLRSMELPGPSIGSTFHPSGWDHVGPTLGAQAMVMDTQDRVLLTRRQDNNHWCLPGGTVEVGESPAVTAIRELWEEAGLRGHTIRLVGVFNGPDWGVSGGHVVAFAYLIHVDDLTPSPGVEMSGTRFFTPTELPEPMQPGHARAISRCIECINHHLVHFDPVTD